MAKTIGDAFVRVRGDTGSLVGDLNKAAKAAGTSSGGAFAGSFGSAIRGVAGLVAGVFAGREVLTFLKESISEQRESVKVNNITAAAIRSTGAAAHVSAGQIGNLADSLGATVGVDDEVIQSGENLILTFTNIRNQAGKGNDIFTQTVKRVTDMTAAMNNGVVSVDGLKSSSIMVGKALQDPIKGLTALQRVGVVFSASQKEQIKNAMKHNDIMSAQKVILGELNKEFGGVAAAAADPAQKATVAWGNFKEMVGGFVLPLVDHLSALFTGRLLPALQTVITLLSTGFASGAGAGSGAVQQFGAVLRTIWNWVSTTGVKIVGDFVGALRQVVNATADVVRWLNQHRMALAITLGIVTGFVAIERVHATVTWLTSGALLAKVVAISAVRGAMLLYAAAQAILNGTVYTWLGVQAIDAAAWIAKTVRIIASSVALAAHAVVMGIVRVATLIWTGAQWLLNAALAASPIGLVVILVAALIAAIVYVAVKTKFFQTTWAAVWSFLKMVGAWFAGPFAGFFVRAYDAVVGAAISAWHGIVGAWNSIVSAAKGALSFYASIPGRILSALGNLGSLLYSAGRSIIQGLINGVESMIGAVGNAISGIASKIKGFLPFSPAKEGPLSGRGDPTLAGRRIAEMLAAGVDSGQGAVSLSLARITSLAAPATAGTGSVTSTSTRAPMTFAPTYNVAGPISERDLSRLTVSRLTAALAAVGR